MREYSRNSDTIGDIGLGFEKVLSVSETAQTDQNSRRSGLKLIKITISMFMHILLPRRNNPDET